MMSRQLRELHCMLASAISNAQVDYNRYHHGVGLTEAERDQALQGYMRYSEDVTYYKGLIANSSIEY